MAMGCPSLVPRLNPAIRILAAIILPAALAGCVTANSIERADDRRPAQPLDPAIVAMYGPVQDGPFLIPAIDVRRIEPDYFRQVVPVPPNIPDEPGTLVVDPGHRFLYLIVDDGQAIRYGIGVGREGFAWSGTAEVKSKQEWPKWFPPADMMARDPHAAPWAKGMPGGLTIRSAPVPSTSGKATPTRSTASTEPPSRGASAMRYRAAAFGCSTRTPSTSTTACPEETKVIVLPAGPAVS